MDGIVDKPKTGRGDWAGALYFPWRGHQYLERICSNFHVIHFGPLLRLEAMSDLGQNTAVFRRA